LQKHLLITRAEEAAAKYADITAGSGTAEGADRLRVLIVQIAEGAATDPRKARVIRLLNDDKPEEASKLLEAIAQDAEKRIKTQMRGVADGFQQYGTIAGLAAANGPQLLCHLVAGVSLAVIFSNVGEVVGQFHCTKGKGPGHAAVEDQKIGDAFGSDLFPVQPATGTVGGDRS